MIGDWWIGIVPPWFWLLEFLRTRDVVNFRSTSELSLLLLFVRQAIRGANLNDPVQLTSTTPGLDLRLHSSFHGLGLTFLLWLLCFQCVEYEWTLGGVGHHWLMRDTGLHHGPHAVVCSDLVTPPPRICTKTLGLVDFSPFNHHGANYE